MFFVHSLSDIDKLIQNLRWLSRRKWVLHWSDAINVLVFIFTAPIKNKQKKEESQLSMQWKPTVAAPLKPQRSLFALALY